MLKLLRHYLLSHWRGQQPLSRAFWLNLVALGVALSTALQWLLPQADEQLVAWRSLPVAAGMLVCVLIFLWQAVGVLRAAEQHIREGGAMAPVWGAQAGVLAIFWIALADLWGLWLTTRVEPAEENVFLRMAREHADSYRLAVSADGRTARLHGQIALGSSEAFAALLAANPGLLVLELSSDGGNIYEGRGLARLVREAGLDTRVVDTCSSACTIAFIGGLRRQLAPGARLGFHQYRVAADYEVPFADPAAEQARDRALFAAAGVAEWFLDGMYRESAARIWYPQIEELRRAGVLVAGDPAAADWRPGER
mgnify:CR=1 FL=1